jgi:diketogulonate reductase-like aldo/keto reductase
VGAIIVGLGSITVQPMQTSPDTLHFPGRIGLGTWMMGGSGQVHTGEVGAIVHALEIGYRLFDTAELYAEGGAERVLGEALRTFGISRRSELFIVSKVLPQNASHSGTVRACEASIERIGCEYLDLYLLHWRGSHRFSETLRGFSDLLQRGLIRHLGVSNLGVEDLARWLEEERKLDLGGRTRCNQLHYSLDTRTIEGELLAWQRARAIQTMAYSPLGRGALTHHRLLRELGSERGATPAQIALAWCLRQPDVVAIPKSSDALRIEENWHAAGLRLTSSELERLDRAFPAPAGARG